MAYDPFHQWDVVIRIPGLERFVNAIATGSSPVVAKILKQWSMIYRGAMQERFARLARGGGVWPPLSPTTIARRRKRGVGGVEILRDTGTLFRALDPVFSGNPGAIEEPNTADFSVVVGYGGPSLHPNKSGRRQVTVADIAKFHNFGMGHNPTRRIIEHPDAATEKRMIEVADQALNKAAKDAAGN